MIEVWVPGVPKTKGSMEGQRDRRTGRVRLVQSVDGSERWAALVTDAVKREYGITQPAGGHVVWHCPTGPVAARLTFWLPQTDVAAGGAGSGDVDKLARNVLDALTRAGAYGDDVQVVSLEVRKYPAREYPGPGLLLELWPVAPAEHRDDWVLSSLSRVLQTAAAWLRSRGRA